MNRTWVRILTGTAASGFGLLLAGAASATYMTITIDGDFSDWAGVPVLDSDPADNPGFVDIAETQVANDDSFLYIRNTFHGGLAAGTFLALDVDDNVSTGYDIFGLGLAGSEAGWQNDFPFTQDAANFNNGLGMSGEFFGSGAANLFPFGDTSSRELALSLDALFNADNSPVYPDDSFTLLIWTDLGSGDVSAPIAYTLSVIPEPSTLVLALLGGVAIVARRRRN